MFPRWSASAQGYRAEPILLTQIRDKDGKALEEVEPVAVEVISPQTSYLIASMMQSVIQEGTGQRPRYARKSSKTTGGVRWNFR